MSNYHHRRSDNILASNLAAQDQDEKSRTMMPDPSKVTVFMRQSLDQLHSSLVCPLCRGLLEAPSTLACGHSFCWKCIEPYSRNNNLCPVSKCGIPLSVTGSRKGSFLKTNPSIETVLSSFQSICKTLDRAPPQWWQQGRMGDDDDDDDDDVNVNDNSSCSSGEEGEMITLDATKNDDDVSEGHASDVQNQGNNSSALSRELTIESEEEE